MRRTLGGAMLLAGVGAPAAMLPPEATAQVPPTRTIEVTVDTARARAQARTRARLAETRVIRLDTTRVRLADGRLRALYGTTVQRGLGIGIADDEDRPGAVRVLSITPRSGAEDGGLRVDDLVTAVDGTRLAVVENATPTEALIREVRLRETGDTIRLTVIRDGREEVRAIEVRPLPGMRVQSMSPVTITTRGTFPDAVVAPRSLAVAIGPRGIQATNLNEGLSGYFGRGDGALVLEVGEGSPEGLRAGDVIVGIDGREVAGVVDLRRIMASYRSGEDLTFRVWREGRDVEVASKAR